MSPNAASRLPSHRGREARFCRLWYSNSVVTTVLMIWYWSEMNFCSWIDCHASLLNFLLEDSTDVENSWERLIAFEGSNATPSCEALADKSLALP